MMKTNKFLLPFLLLFSQTIFAQTDSITWQKSGAVQMSFANVGLSNWAGGGNSAVSVGFLGKAELVRTTTKTVWKTNLQIALGGASLDNGLFKKTDDLLSLQSTFDKKLSTNFSYNTFFNFQSQTLAGFTYKTDSLGKESTNQRISNIFAPAYMFLGTGFQYQKGIFSVNFSPISAKFTVVADEQLSQKGAFGVEKGKKFRSELGTNLSGKLKIPIMKNVQLESDFNLFGNYETLRTIDVFWNTVLLMQVNEYLNVGFTTNLIYDDDIQIVQKDGSSRQAVQFKHVLNVNFGLNF